MTRVADRIVAEIVAPRRAVVLPEDTVEYVRRLMRDHGYRLVAVIDKTGKLLGVIGRENVLQVSSTKSEAVARSIMREPLVVLEEDMGVRDAVSRMLKVDEWYAPVVKGGILKAVMGLEDVIEWGLRDEVDRRVLEDVKLEDIMTRNPVAVYVDESITRAWRIMMEHRYSGLPVVDERMAVVGIVTQYDLIKKGYARPHLESEGGPGRRPKVKTVMTRPCTYLYPWSSALEAATIMINRNIGRIPVVESDKTRRLVGIVDREDIVRLLIK